MVATIFNREMHFLVHEKRSFCAERKLLFPLGGVPNLFIVKEGP